MDGPLNARLQDVVPAGSERFFEYHCNESHASEHAQLWYRSHRKVIVGQCDNPEFTKLTRDQREEGAVPLVYEIIFADGFRHYAFEDELCESESDYERPAPPRGAR